MRITTNDTKRYTKTAALIVITMFLTTIAVSYLSSMTTTIKQTWMINLTNTCGEKFETDSDGNFVVHDIFSRFFKGVIADSAVFFGSLGLYFGQVIFRYKGYGRLGKNAYTSRTGLEQIFYALCIYALI